jgi:hypothetical protein
MDTYNNAKGIEIGGKELPDALLINEILLLLKNGELKVIRPDPKFQRRHDAVQSI